MLKCGNCNAECRDKKDERRFLRRHPKRCVSHQRFQSSLAQATASVDYDDEVEAVEMMLEHKKLSFGLKK